MLGQRLAPFGKGRKVARVFIPTQLRALSGAADSIEIEANTLADVMAGLERTFPGIQEKLMEGDKIASRYSIIIDGSLASKSLWTPVDPTSEVHFLPAISGGTR